MSLFLPNLWPLARSICRPFLFPLQPPTKLRSLLLFQYHWTEIRKQGRETVSMSGFDKLHNIIVITCMQEVLKTAFHKTCMHMCKFCAFSVKPWQKRELILRRRSELVVQLSILTCVSRLLTSAKYGSFVIRAPFYPAGTGLFYRQNIRARAESLKVLFFILLFCCCLSLYWVSRFIDSKQTIDNKLQ